MGIKNFFKDESGASAVEYGLLITFIALVIIAAVTTLGTNSLRQVFRRCGWCWLVGLRGAG